MNKIKYGFIALAGMNLISGCSPREIRVDDNHYYLDVESRYGEELRNDYLVSISKKSSGPEVLESYTDTLNAIAKSRGESLSSICNMADRNGDNIIDDSEIRSLLKIVGKFEVTDY